MIDNPDYKGPWMPKQIANPDYKVEARGVLCLGVYL